MACSKIFAQPSTVTGSIGVISAKFSSAALLKRLRIWTAVTTAGDDSFAGMQYAAHRPWSEEEWHRMNHWTREIYDGMTTRHQLSLCTTRSHCVATSPSASVHSCLEWMRFGAAL